MTKQETFDLVVAHARKQGCRSTYRLSCRYRHPTDTGTLKCFVGALIPDDLYRPIMEGRSADHEDVSPTLEVLGIPLHFASILQLIHDESAPQEWESRFRRLAQDHNLTYTAP